MEILKSKVEELLVNAAIDQARYLFCFNSIVKELEDKETKLKKAQDGIKKVIEDKRQKRPDIVVEKDVTDWLKDVDRELDDVQKLKAERDEKDSSLHGLCPNWCCRYLLGRKASEKTRKLFDLLQGCSQFKTVAFPKPLPLERELSLPSHFTSTFETTESACIQIIDALKRESTKMVGLHGLGGVGKTTLAKFVGNQLRQQKVFHKLGIATVSRHPTIINVQNELANSLGWELEQKDEKDGADQLRSMFSASKSTKILIILDDVWNVLNLKEKLGIPIGDRDNCCKILLTTRKKSVCDSFDCYPQIPLDTLTLEEGLTLLKKNAGIDANDSTLDGVSKQVAAECKGLPLAIKAVGSALHKGKGFDEWNLALKNLKEAKLYAIEGIDKNDQDVYGCLKFSYDNLNSEESKLCFLLCSLFPEDYEIYLEDLVGYAVGFIWYRSDPSIENARSQLRGTIKGLKAASLLLDTGNDISVKMHDIVRDVAIWIGSVVFVEKKFFSKVGIELGVRAMEESLEQYRGISLVGNKKEKLRSGLVCPNLHILRLENTLYDYKLQVPAYIFEGMPALKIVTIIGGVLSLKSLQILANNLLVLQLIGCDVRKPSFLRNLKRLELLYLQSSPIEIPKELPDELPNLKLLHIGSSSISPITIKKFLHLEEFYGWIKKWEFEGMSSEESNVRLAELNSHADGSVVCLPKDFTFPELQRYVIGKGEGVVDEVQLQRFVIGKGEGVVDEMKSGDKIRSLIIKNDPPEATSLVIFSALYQNLEFLHLRGLIGCHNIVPSIDKRGLNELTHLLVINCEGLECMVDASQSPYGKSGNHEVLSRLARLYLSKLPELTWIWKPPGQHVINLQTLTELNVHKCNNLTYIFTLSLARSLEQLKSLEVSKCERLKCIVEAKSDHNEGEISVGDGNAMLTLPLLRELTLLHLPELISFCSENYYSIWPALEELDLSICPNLTVNSTELEANLQYLGEKLRTLNVYDCSHLRDTIPALLKHGLKNLEELHISEIGVQVVFQLEAIIAYGQENKLFPCLKVLLLEDLRELQVLYYEGPTHNCSLQNLTYLSVEGCTKLKRLLSSTLARNLLQLEHFSIENCLKLEQIIDEDEDEDEDHLQPACFPKLEVIDVIDCPKLKRLFHISVAPSLQKLARLCIEGSDEIEEVFWHKDGADVMDYDEIVMDEFLNLTLVNLPNLTNFWPTGYQIPFPSAEIVNVHNCPKLRANSGGDR